MWCTGETFLPIMRALSALGYECYAPTLRGHGDSKHVENLGKVSISDYIADIRGFLKALGQKVVLLGHSMGEIIASNVAMLEPELILAHIGMTSAPPRGMLMGLQTILRMPKYLLRMFQSKPIELTWNDAEALLFNRVPTEYHEALAEAMVPESGTAAREITLGKYAMKRLTCPALVIAGAFDQITPNQEGVARRLGADFRKVDCGHMVMNDPNIGSVISLINTWLRVELPRAIMGA
jgi:pimeloyl-ACP methyl ester carboxylesterase